MLALAVTAIAQPPLKTATTAASAIPSATTAVVPEYSGVFYTTRDTELVPLPRQTPEVKGRLKSSMIVAVTKAKEVESPRFLVRLDGSGDPSSVIQMAAVDNGKILLRDGDFSTFAKVVDIKVNPLGNRVFEVIPENLSQGTVYALMLKEKDPFSVGQLYLFRVASNAIVADTK